MPLKSYQVTILPTVLYSAQVMGGVSGIGAQISPSIEIIGTGTVYTSQNQPVSAPTNMYAPLVDFTGIAEFNIVPNYIYITGTPTSVVLSGIEVVAV